MNKFYLISIDKDLGGQYFFYSGRTEKIHPEYGTVTYNTSIKDAKHYEDLEKAVKDARQILPIVGFKQTLYVHEWTPQTFMGTKIVERI